MDKKIIPVSILIFFLSTPILSAFSSVYGQTTGTSGTNMFSTADSGSLVSNLELDSSATTQIQQYQDSESRLKLFKDSDDAKKLDLFYGLSSADKMRYFSWLVDSDKLKYFRGLNKEDQADFFKGLDTSLQIDFYNKLNKSEQANVLSGLNQYEQANLFEVLSKQKDASGIENILSGQFPTGIERTLTQYGYSFFSKDIATFEPITNIPVGSDYIIGPGDSFTIYLWGGAEENYSATVSRDGNIIIPRLGTLSVNGLTFEELKEFLGRKFKEYFNDFEINITMGALRTIKIFLVGEAKNPGTYSVSSLSTIISALYAMGGPTKNGSLRNINLIRNGETLATLDLYDFFIKGIKDNDLRLEPGDTIFIPMIEPVVGISGYVKRPAIYEMKGSQTIRDIIEMAGGVLPVSYLQNVILERITDHQKRIVKTFNLDPNNIQANDELNTVLKDGDLIKIYPVDDTLHQVVYLEGHVKYPREYEFKEGMKVSDLIPSYNYLLNEPYLPAARIVRLMPPDLHTEYLQFNLEALMSGDETQDISLQDKDRIIIYDKWDKQDRPQVTIKGEVRGPGIYNLVDDMSIKDLIFTAGNLTERAYLGDGDITRFIEGEDDTESLTMKFSVEKALQGSIEDNLKLEANDIVYIRAIPFYSEALGRKAYLEGEFLFPGEYSFSEGERLSSVISRAGGLTEEAYPFGAIFQREEVKETLSESYEEYKAQLENDIISLTAMVENSASLDKEDLALVQTTLTEKRELLEKLQASAPTGRMLIDLDSVLLTPSSDYDLKLRSGDRLIVSKRRDFINVTGEVYNTTALLFEEGRDVEYYLDKVGGITKSAAKRQIYIVKANGTVISRQQGGLLGFGLWDQGNSRWSFGKFGSIELDPGDSIIVPQKTTKINWLKGISNVTSVVYQLAVAAAVIRDYASSD